MRIMVRDKGEAGWKPLDASKYDSEAHLQDLLDRDISLIPIEPPLIACVREFGLPGSGSSDIIAVDRDGAITVIECKLAKSREIRRMVIGQLLEYAAFLAKMTVDEFVETFNELLGAPLYQTMADKLGEEFEESAFKDALAENLNQGEFTLIVAVDKINDELREIILYLNAHSDCTVGALELEYFKDSERELLVPRLYGGPEAKEAAKKTSERSTRMWNKDSFLKALKEYNENESDDEEKLTERQLQGMEELLNFTLKTPTPGKIVWGKGQYEGSFYFVVDNRENGKKVITRIFLGWTDGSIAIHSWDIERALDPKLKESVISEFWKKLKSAGIESFEEENRKNKYYRTWLDATFLGNPSSVETFKQAVLWMRDKIRSYEEE